MSLIPPVRAKLAERFIFNFRMPLDAMQAYLPAPWLLPQPVQGYGVASFCLLDLQHITVSPLPAIVGLHSISCAPRYAVLDVSDGSPQPAVFVTKRHTSSAFGAWFTGLGFSCQHPYAPASIRHRGPETELRVDESPQSAPFQATVRAAEETNSALFGSAGEFAAFIAQGVSSYGLSRYPNRLTKVDLHKQDYGYEPLDVLSLNSPLLEEWQADGAVLDSAFRTQGGQYEWTYHGLTNVKRCTQALEGCDTVPAFK